VRGKELRRGTSVSPEVGSASIEQQVEAIRAALGRIRTIKTKVTELGGCADVINEQASQLREEVKEAKKSPDLYRRIDPFCPDEGASRGKRGYDGQGCIRQLGAHWFCTKILSEGFG
jgi:hypothetical protein